MVELIFLGIIFLLVLIVGHILIFFLIGQINIQVAAIRANNDTDLIKAVYKTIYRTLVLMDSVTIIVFFSFVAVMTMWVLLLVFTGKG